jgi:cyclic pyranopterin phosphate synthase
MTGGEPLVRRHLPVLAEKLANTPGIEDLSLSTNGVQLSRYAHKLYDAGINRLNVSLDTLDPTLFHQLTGGGKLSKVLQGLMAAKTAGFGPVKINMVVMEGVNDHEVVAMTRFCMRHGFILRFIETMPMGEGGQSAFNTYLPLDIVKERLEKHYRLSPCITPGGGPARYMRVYNSDLTVGFITPISQHFCETCNRVRLSVDGTLYLCVGHNDSYPLRELLRSGISDRKLQGHIREAISLKPQRHNFNGNSEQVIRPMGYTGG